MTQTTSNTPNLNDTASHHSPEHTNTQPQRQPRVLMMAAGTGGHVFPALAVADELAKQGAIIHWLGTPNGMENDLVKPTGYQFHAIHMQGLRGNGIMRLIKAPMTLMKAVLEANQVIKQHQIDVVVGFGGYVTAPGGLAAKLSGKPIIIHEQNAIAGMSNHYLAKIANRVMQAFDNTFPASDKVITVGNPVRQAIIDLPNPTQRFAKKNDDDAKLGNTRLNLLVVGGSLGAKALNDVIAPTLAILAQQSKVAWQVRHQCGKNNVDATQAIYDASTLDQTSDKVNVEVMPFIADMAAAYEWADVIVCRAGALTVTEIANVGLPAVFVPLPHAVDDHQTANARLLVEKQAAFLLPQKELTAETLANILAQLDRPTCLAMAQKSLALANPHASKQAADIIVHSIP